MPRWVECQKTADLMLYVEILESIWREWRKILNKERRYESVDWINLAQNKDYWQKLLTTATDIRVMYNVRIIFSSWLTVGLSGNDYSLWRLL